MKSLLALPDSNSQRLFSNMREINKRMPGAERLAQLESALAAGVFVAVTANLLMGLVIAAALAEYALRRNPGPVSEKERARLIRTFVFVFLFSLVLRDWPDVKQGFAAGYEAAARLWRDF